MKSSIIHSVSALFIFEDRIFAVQRQSYLKAFPGYLAFPGGKIDLNESSEPFKTKYLCKHNPVYMRALNREINEELGYDLEEGINNQDVLSINEFTEVLAPEFSKIRFRTRFYRIDLRKKINFRPDSGEFANSFWETPCSLLNTFIEGNSLMVPPTRWILEELKQKPNTKILCNLSAKYDKKDKIPCLEMLEGIQLLPVRSTTLPPANSTNAFLLGDSEAKKLLIDPSPNSKKEFQKLINTIKDKKIDSIFLTHHHPDHHQFSNVLARQMNIPILLSKDTQQRLTKKFGTDYFDRIKLFNPVEKQEVTKWHGESVRIFEIPGHDVGHLGLAPDSMKWFLVGDLIQGVGTVVIPSPEGDMASYLSTLKKVISLNPEVIIPSHGIPSRSTYLLDFTLKHRLERESQILKLFNSGNSKKTILKKLYVGIDPRLEKLAMQNIESHLSKLYKEKRLII